MKHLQGAAVLSIIAVTEAIVAGGAVRATKYLDDKFIIRATRKTFHGRILRGNIEICLTLGRPNFAERKFIKACKKAGEKFPIKKVQLKWAKPR